MSDTASYRLPSDAIYDGATPVTWMAGLVNVAIGDIVEIRWGVFATQWDKGKSSVGTVVDLSISEGSGIRGRFRRGELTFQLGWHERCVHALTQDECIMFVPDVHQMGYRKTFDLRTDDFGDEAWTLVICGHDCEAHEGSECTSMWRERAAVYLAKF